LGRIFLLCQIIDPALTLVKSLYHRFIMDAAVASHGPYLLATREIGVVQAAGMDGEVVRPARDQNLILYGLLDPGTHGLRGLLNLGLNLDPPEDRLLDLDAVAGHTETLPRASSGSNWLAMI
jgi:hypothetical protein